MPSMALATSARAAFPRLCTTAAASSPSQGLVAKRAFSSLPSLRPTLLPRASSSVFRPSTLGLTAASPSTTPTDPSAMLDLVPRAAISASPLFAGVQIRCGPRPTMARTSRLKGKRKHGFLARKATRTGRMMLQRRRNKGRRKLAN